MYCEYIFVYYFKVAKYPTAKQRVKDHGNIRAYTLWILSDCASAEVIYIVPVTHLTPLLFKMLRVLL